MCTWKSTHAIPYSRKLSREKTLPLYMYMQIYTIIFISCDCWGVRHFFLLCSGGGLLCSSLCLQHEGIWPRPDGHAPLCRAVQLAWCCRLEASLRGSHVQHAAHRSTTQQLIVIRSSRWDKSYIPTKRNTEKQCFSQLIYISYKGCQLTFCLTSNKTVQSQKGSAPLHPLSLSLWLKS